MVTWVRARQLIVAGAVAALGVALAGAGPARAALLDPVQLTISGPGAGGPGVAITPGGWTLVAWTDASAHVSGAWRPPGGPFGAAFTIADGSLGPRSIVATADEKVVVSALSGFVAGSVGSVVVLDAGATSGPSTVLGTQGGQAPALAADGRGRAVAAFFDAGGITVSTRPRGGAFGPPERVVSRPAQLPIVAANPAGDVAVAYFDNAIGPAVSIRPAESAAFLPPEKVPIPGALFAVQLAVTDGGDVAEGAFGPAAGFAGGTDGGSLAIRPRGGAFTAQKLNTNGTVDQLIPAPGNQLSIIDSSPSQANIYGGVLRSFDRQGDGTLSAPVAISPPDACSPQTALTPKDATILVYAVPCGPHRQATLIALSERPPRAGYSTAFPISQAGSHDPAVAVNRSGAVAIAWAHDTTPRDDSPAVIQAVVRDGQAELGVLAVDQVLQVVGDIVRPLLGCTGLINCDATLELLPVTPGASAAATRHAARKPLARQHVRVRRGHSNRVRLRLPRDTIRHRTRATLVITLKHVKGRGARRTLKVILLPRR